LFTQKLIAQRQLGFYVVEGRLGDTDPPWVCRGFQSRGNVDAVPVAPVPLLDHVPQVDSDAEPHPPVLRQIGVPGLQFILCSNPALDGIHHARKLRQEVVTRGVHHPAPVLLDQGEHDLLVGLESLDRSRFILADI
jgi:hypothetical protein